MLGPILVLGGTMPALVVISMVFIVIVQLLVIVEALFGTHGKVRIILSSSQT